MHEIGIAGEAHRLCRARLDADSGLRLSQVWLAVGELTAVEPELLRFAWTAVTAGGPDEGCLLHVEWCPARQVCDACGEAVARPAGSWTRLCPRCTTPLRIEGGEDLDVVRLEAVPAGEPDEVGA